MLQKSILILTKRLLLNSSASVKIHFFLNSKSMFINRLLTMSIFYSFMSICSNANIMLWCSIFWDWVWRIFSIFAIDNFLLKWCWCWLISFFIVLNIFTSKMLFIVTSNQKISWWILKDVIIRCMSQIWALSRNVVTFK